MDTTIVGCPLCEHNLNYQLTHASTLKWKPPYTMSTIQFARVGNMVFINGNVKFAQSGVNNYQKVNETIPVGYRPIAVNSPIHFLGSQFACLCDPQGGVTALGNPNSGYSSAQGAWVTSDPQPTV